jgi:hypothetical protein
VSRALSIDELLALPLVVDVPTAGRAYGIGERLAYELARRDELGVPVLRRGRRLLVRRRDLIADLAPDMSEDPAPTGSIATANDADKERRDAPHGTPRPLRSA